MEWQQILGFHQAAKLGSFTKAAEATFRTQSALSHQIKALEEEMDCKLFERIGRRKLRLTPAGEKFYQFSMTLFKHYDHLIGEINNLKDKHVGNLAIAGTFGTLYYILTPKLKSFTHSFPQVRLTIMDLPPSSVVELVSNGDIDLGVTLETAVEKDLVKRRIDTAECFLATPIGHPLTKIKDVTIEQIAKYPLVFPPLRMKYTLTGKLEELFQDSGIKYHAILKSSNLDLRVKYVEMGLGITPITLTNSLEILKNREIELISLRKYIAPDYYVVIYRKDKILEPYIDFFIQQLEQDLSS
jgi:DNA-binding transcriptional LysR family regulator